LIGVPVAFTPGLVPQDDTEPGLAPVLEPLLEVPVADVLDAPLVAGAADVAGWLELVLELPPHAATTSASTTTTTTIPTGDRLFLKTDSLISNTSPMRSSPTFVLDGKRIP
jgi:hypothetical protein